jgi:phi LC3 family holin
MKIDWKARLKNKAFLVSLLSALVAFVYQILGMFGVVAPVSQDTIIQIVGLVVNLLVGLGIVVNPTTDGMGD